MTNFRLSNITGNKANEIHALDFFPNPYPSYPRLITRTLNLDEAKTIEELYDVLELRLPIDPEDRYLRYGTVLDKIFAKGEKSLDPMEQALLQFGNVLICFCYDTRRRGTLDTELKLIWTLRRMRGVVLRRGYDLENSGIRLTRALDKDQVDQILEEALRRNDFGAIRAVLNYEGYDIPVVEPNDLIAQTEWDNKESSRFDCQEIEMTSEEREIWNAPLPAFGMGYSLSRWSELLDSDLGDKAIIFLRDSLPPHLRDTVAPQFPKSEIQKGFLKSMADRVPIRLENLIRRRDVRMLRTMLRLYGHGVYPNSEDVQDMSKRLR